MGFGIDNPIFRDAGGSVLLALCFEVTITRFVSGAHDFHEKIRSVWGRRTIFHSFGSQVYNIRFPEEVGREANWERREQHRAIVVYVFQMRAEKITKEEEKELMYLTGHWRKLQDSVV